MSLILCICGIIIMVLNLMHLIHVCIKLKKVNHSSSIDYTKMRFVGKVDIVLVSFFLAGYIAIPFLENTVDKTMLISQILFWGAIFVSFSIYLFISFFKTLRDEVVYDVGDMQLSLDTYIRAVPGGVHHCVMEPEPAVTYVSKGFTDITGYTIEDFNSLYNGKYIGIIYESDREVLIAALEYMLKHMTSVTVNYRIRSKRGNIVWISDSMNVVKDSRGKKHIFAVVLDITSEKNDAQTDSLTNLLNKGTFNKLVREYMARKQNETFALFMIDLNYFKMVNDNYGHQVGDYVLEKTAEFLREFFDRKRALIGRVGGDEFMVLLKNVEPDSDEISRIKEKMEKDFRITIPKMPEAPPVLASIGCIEATCREDFDEVFKKADMAMYREKEKKHRINE